MIEVACVGPDDPLAAEGDVVLRGALPGQGFSVVDESRKREALTLVARDGDHVVGAFVGWVVVDELHVLAVGTDARARRRGVGRALLDAAFREGRARGAVRALLEVARTNAPALALYRAFGFHVSNLRRAYYANGDDALDLDVRWDPQGAPLPGVDAPPLG